MDYGEFQTKFQEILIKFFFHLCFNLSFFMASDSHGESIAMEVIQDDEVHCHQVETLFFHRDRCDYFYLPNLLISTNHN